MTGRTHIVRFFGDLSSVPRSNTMLYPEQLDTSERIWLSRRVNQKDSRAEDESFDAILALFLTAMSFGVVVAFFWAWGQIQQMWSGM